MAVLFVLFVPSSLIANKHEMFSQIFFFFCVLLTMHLSIIPTINHLNAQTPILRQVSYMPVHVLSTMCSSSGGHNCIVQHLVSSHSVGSHPVHRLGEDSCAMDGHLQVWRYQMLYNTIVTSWWWAQQCSKHVEAYNNFVVEREFVH